MKKQAALFLIIIAAFACSQGATVSRRPQKVLGVKLGGSVDELKTVYEENGLSLRETAEDRYVSADVAKLPAGLPVAGVSYQVSSGVVRTMEVNFTGDFSGELQIFIDEEYSTDPGQRQQLEQKQRFIGTIGENDHYWLLPDMGVMVIVRQGETRLIYNLK